MDASTALWSGAKWRSRMCSAWPFAVSRNDPGSSSLCTTRLGGLVVLCLPAVLPPPVEGVAADGVPALPSAAVIGSPESRFMVA